MPTIVIVDVDVFYFFVFVFFISFPANWIHTCRIMFPTKRMRIRFVVRCSMLKKTRSIWRPFSIRKFSSISFCRQSYFMQDIRSRGWALNSPFRCCFGRGCWYQFWTLLSLRNSQKYFFRNLGAILTFAIVGTSISALLIGSLMYGAVQFLPGKLNFTFLDTLYFGALISPTVCECTSRAKGIGNEIVFLSLTGSADNPGDIQRIACWRQFVCVGVWGKCIERCRCHCYEQVMNRRSNHNYEIKSWSNALTLHFVIT